MSQTRVDSVARPCVNGSRSPVCPSPRQPRGLYVICATVGLERFSFSVLSAFLVLYLTGRLGVRASIAVEVYGYFLCGSYLTPLLGGWLCDGRMGYRRTALLGGALQAVGYVMFFAERVDVIYAALPLMSIGSGLFKAGTQAALASLYTSADSRGETGFRVLYLAINVGALCAPLLGGWIQEYAGWTWCFALASLFAVLSFSVATLGGLGVGGASTRSFVEISPSQELPHRLARRQLGLVLVAGMVFAVGFVQSHSSLLLWARDRTERHIGGIEIPVAWFAAAPAALVLLVAPLLSAIFSLLRRKQLEPSTLRKIALGLAVSGLACVSLWIASMLIHPGPRVSPLWVLTCMTMLAIGELLVPALAPAETIRIAPRTQQGRWLSYWFVSMAAGNVVGGWVHF